MTVCTHPIRLSGWSDIGVDVGRGYSGPIMLATPVHCATCGDSWVEVTEWKPLPRVVRFRLLRRLWARLTRCNCRTMPTLDHVTRTEHVRNERPPR